MKFDRITFDSQIMGGRACIRGMRIPVSVTVGQIAHGATSRVCGTPATRQTRCWARRMGKGKT
jgi:uncharacterized protein (DUF433 family)